MNTAEVDPAKNAVQPLIVPGMDNASPSMRRARLIDLIQAATARQI